MLWLWIILIFIAVFAFLYVLYVGKSKTPDKGEEGERQIAKLLESCMREGDQLINNLIVINPENGKSSEIDHILFSTRGIFVIETKNLSDDIYGDDFTKQWKQSLADGEIEHEFLSPVIQNGTHIYALKKILKTKVWLENIVVFAQGNTQFVKSEFVYTPEELRDHLNGKTENIVSARERDRLYNIVLRYKENPVISQSQHIENINRQQHYYD